MTERSIGHMLGDVIAGYRDRDNKRTCTAMCEILDLLRAQEDELIAWRECARYDPQMEGPAFKGWDRSGLDRCRKQYIEKKS